MHTRGNLTQRQRLGNMTKYNTGDPMEYNQPTNAEEGLAAGSVPPKNKHISQVRMLLETNLATSLIFYLV